MTALFPSYDAAEPSVDCCIDAYPNWIYFGYVGCSSVGGVSLMGTESNKYYGNQLWRKARRHFLAHNLFCVMCSARNEFVPATVVDHIIPHKGDQILFWDQNNWQALCVTCHNKIKKSHESRGLVDADGWPVDKNA